MPARRTLGPSRHHIGPSPSQTRMGVHVKDWPEAMALVAAKAMRSMRVCNGVAQQYANRLLDEPTGFYERLGNEVRLWTGRDPAGLAFYCNSARGERPKSVTAS